LTQEALAEAAGVNTRTIKRLESGAQSPRHSTLQLIAKALTCSWEEFYRSTLDLAGAPVPGDPPAFLDNREAESPAPVQRFVAREKELDTLRHALGDTLTGQPQIVFVTGEAGTGKTALMHEFARRAWDLPGEPVIVSGHCNSHTGFGDPYLPFREVLGLLTGDVEARWIAGTVTTRQARRLWNLLPIAIGAIARSSPDLINTFVAGDSLVTFALAYARQSPIEIAALQQIVARKAQLPPDVSLQQNDLFEQLTRVLQAIADERPLIVMIDDLQWTDPGSASLLFHLSQRLSGHRILLVGAFRPSEIAQERDGNRHILDSLVNEIRTRFGRYEIDLDNVEPYRFIDALLETEPNRLDATFRDTLLRQTAGHPFFTIELLRAMQEQGALTKDEKGHWIEAAALDWRTLPRRVEAAIEERVARLDETSRDILRLAAVEGETFTAQVLASLIGADEEEVIRLLSTDLDRRHHLVTARETRRANQRRISRYQFAHILIQKYLYGTSDHIERSHTHERLATALESLYGERAVDVAPELARHFQEAGCTEKSIEYLQLAGQRAAALSAHTEAAAHFRRGLDLLATSSLHAHRPELELGLLSGLMPSLTATEGYGSSGLASAASRAQSLCEVVGETPSLIPTLTFLTIVHGERGYAKSAFDTAQQMIDRASGALEEAIAYGMRSWTYFLLGEFEETLTGHERLYAEYDPDRHAFLRHTLGFDLKAIALGYDAAAACFLGYPGKGNRMALEAIELSRELDHPATLSFAIATASVGNVYVEDWGAVENDIRELEETARDIGASFWQSWSLWFRGALMVRDGACSDGLALMRNARQVLSTVGTEAYRTLTESVCVEFLVEAGLLDDAAQVLEDVFSFIERSSEGLCEADCHRVLAELRIAQRAPSTEIESCFEHAVRVARRRRAKLQELKATASWARWLEQQGRRDQGREMLSGIYAWFTEGFETRPLREARELLDHLGPADTPDSST
jgi:predicted ATPase/DNA-binding XRE family transcriptional regulator